MKTFLITASFLLCSIAARPCSAQLIAEFQPASPAIAALPGGARFDGQTFTAISSGSLGTLSVLGQRFGASSFDITVQFRTVSAGLPTSTILGSVTVASSALSNSALSTLSADFSSQNISIVAGESYALLLSGPSMFALGGKSNGYAGGQQVISLNSGASFSAFAPAQDLSFTASLAAAPVPEPSTYCLVTTAGLFGLIGLRRFRRGASRAA